MPPTSPRRAIAPRSVSPPRALGRKAIKAIPASYKGPLMSLSNRVLSGGAVGEAEVRRYVREFAPSEAAHPSLALNEYAQLNAIAAPSARVRCVTEGSNLEWRLESGALLRSWKPFEGMTKFETNFYMNGPPGVHHYVGAAGAELLVSFVFDDGGMIASGFRDEWSGPRRRTVRLTPEEAAGPLGRLAAELHDTKQRLASAEDLVARLRTAEAEAEARDWCDCCFL